MILVIGYGKMGHLHTAALQELGHEYHLLDIDDNINDYDFSKYSHFIVSSPNETHVPYYHMLKIYGKPILLEKPGVIKIEDIDILKDPLVSVGMSRRFHPITNWCIKEDVFKYVKKLQTVKLAPKKYEVPAILDFGIHHIDLACYLDLSIDTIAEYSNTKADLIQIIYEDNSVILLDYINNILMGPDLILKFNEPDFSIKLELEHWLAGNRIDAYEAHEILLKEENGS